MRYRKKLTGAKLVSGTGFLNQTHLTSDDVVAAILVFCDVADMMDIV